MAETARYARLCPVAASPEHTLSLDEPLVAHFHYFLLRGAGHERDPADPCADLPQNHTGPARMEPGCAGHRVVFSALHRPGPYPGPAERHPGQPDTVAGLHGAERRHPQVRRHTAEIQPRPAD